jgi:Nickel/cobalt transporter regulator
MRKALFGILMAATAAMPIAAQAQEPDVRAARAERNAQRYEALGERNQARSERREQRQEVRQERQETRQQVRVQRQERAAPVQVQQQQQQQAQSWGGSRRSEGQRTERWSGGRNDTNREAYRQRVEETRAANQQSIDQSIGGNYAREGLRNQRRVEQNLREDYGIRQRDGRRDLDRDRRGDNRWSDNRGSRRSSWNHSWRNDSRYDWQRYRYSNRNLFRSGGYYAPYRNYRYNRLSIGIVLDSLFYSNRYWLSDPFQYRLPPAPYGTQWVRYYDDVVLVDVYTGEVLDVIENFFW